MHYITVVIQYPDDQQPPPIHGFMPCLGGKIVTVQFNNALEDKDDDDDWI